MKAQTKAKLQEAKDYCDDNDKSTEFTLQYMQDVAGVDLDCVINFIQKTSVDDIKKHTKAHKS